MFFNSVNELFISDGKNKLKMQGYFELKNYQQTGPVELENTRIWLTNVFVGRHFNQFLRGEMKRYILKRVIINDSTDSSWLFKRFDKVHVIANNKTSIKI